tara:strand:+ start:94 stop:441 length:348 start_codon:yes stop_codon:yes gene_type:complete
MLNPKNASLFNALTLITVGLLGYFLKSSITALIPVFFGLLILICYFVYDKNNKIVAHICVVLMLVVFLSLFMPLKARIADNDIFGILRVATMQIVSLYAIVCFVLSFIKARSKED